MTIAMAVLDGDRVDPRRRGELSACEREWAAARRTSDRWLARVAAHDAVRSALDVHADVVIRRSSMGRPMVWVDGRCADPFESPGCPSPVLVSLAHDRGLAVAVAAPWHPDASTGEPGVDIVPHRRISRWDSALEAAMRRRVLVASERACDIFAGPEGLAVAVAAKEAVGKATRRLDPTLGWLDVEVTSGPDTGGPSFAIEEAGTHPPTPWVRTMCAWSVRSGTTVASGTVALLAGRAAIVAVTLGAAAPAAAGVDG